MVEKCWGGFYVYQGNFAADRAIIIQDSEIGHIGGAYNEANGDRAAIGLRLTRGVKVRRCYIHDQGNANQTGTDIIESSKDLKNKSYKFWMKAFLASFCSWTARYWVVNSILLAFWCCDYTTLDHIMIFARQLLMWIMMLISPTPGGSGFSEWVFTQYLGDFIPEAGLTITLALIWRLISYYPYLFIGMYMLPKWIKKNF